MVYLVSDDDDGDWKANYGVTLPEGSHATYSIMLPPLFFNHVGYAASLGDHSVHGIGEKAWYWSGFYIKNGISKRLYIDFEVYPSDHNNPAYAHSLRCLVSTNNMMIINLVSDDLERNNWGVTLPGTTNATHSVNLSPLFFFLPGHSFSYVGNWAYVVDGRGIRSRYIASTASSSSKNYRLAVTHDTTQPTSAENRLKGLSLRCLVSTNNR